MCFGEREDSRLPNKHDKQNQSRSTRVLRDLPLVRAVKPLDDLEFDASLWRQLLSSETFAEPVSYRFMGVAKAKAKAKPRAKRNPVRQAAYEYLKALDHTMVLSTGSGLKRFAAPAERPCGMYWGRRPVLSLCMDQGSDGWSAGYFVSYNCLLRMLVFFDPFHREHNDVSNGIKAAGAWSVVLLTGMIHNLCYGPWDGCKWYANILRGLDEYLSHANWQDPLWQAFYAQICSDLGIDIDMQGPEHCRELFESLREFDCFSKKGPRTAHRRWFSWFGAHSWHRKFWHARHFIICYIGLRLKVYKNLASIPLGCSSGVAVVQRPVADDGEGDAEEVDLAVVDQAIQHDEHAADRAAPVDDDGPVRQTGREQLKELYKKCKHAMFVAGSIYGRDDLLWQSTPGFDYNSCNVSA